MKHYEVEPNGEIPLKVGLDGREAAEPLTVMQVMQRTVAAVPKRKAMAVKRNGAWQSWTYQEFYEDVKLAAKAMIRLGLEPHHAVGICGFNSPEWFIADLAAIYAGGVVSGIYTTNGPEALQYVASHSRSQIMVVEDDKQLQKVLQVESQLPMLKVIVQYTGTVNPEYKERAVPVLEWTDFMRYGRDLADFELGARVAAQRPGHCATLIYTSGTTGNPKAVMISHDNLTWTSIGLASLLKISYKKEEHFISYLPLSHIAAQITDIHAPLAAGATIWFAQPDALKGTLPITLREVRPTLFLGVPRVWEKIEEGMKKKGAESRGLKKKIAAWARGVGTRTIMAQEGQGRRPRSFWLANALVFKKVRKALGLDRCRIMVTSAAPISRQTLDFFNSLYIPLSEVFGMSECTGPATVSILARRTGSCGQNMIGAEVKIDNPDVQGNGEVCMRGRHVFMGYLGNDEKTREAIDGEGWLHSGDIGRIDEHGFVYITGRIKELLITAGGENVAPVPIEDEMKAAMPFISNVMVVGDQKKFLSMIVTLKCDVNLEDGSPTTTLTTTTKAHFESLGAKVETSTEAAKHPAIIAAINAGMQVANKKAVSNAARVQKFVVVERDFSIPGGELGPTLKLRRNIVLKQYEKLVNDMYTGPAE